MKEPDPELKKRARELLGNKVSFNENIGQLTTYKVGGQAAVFVRAECLEDLRAVTELKREYGLEALVIGNGSNLLVADEGVEAIVVKLGRGFASFDISEPGSARFGGAALMPQLARICAREGVAGLTWAVGVPGSFGGAVKMNAGGHGSDTKATLKSVRLLNLDSGEAVFKSADELELSYRHSNLKDGEVVLEVFHELSRDDPEELLRQVDEIVKWRLKNQPGGKNAGSVFVNPEGDYAARIIEELGLKGFRIGSAYVSERHANFIQVKKNGRARDVYEVICAVRERVLRETGIELALEVKLWGF